MTNEVFPFEFIKLNEEKCPFLQNVERILNADIQEKKSFGCKINSCHTHAGSKIHFGDFIEAELLFQNNYYNRGFAYLTTEQIIKWIDNSKKNYNGKTQNIILIGYENFSELYLQEVQRLIRDYDSSLKCEYCIYETVVITDHDERVRQQRIRNLNINDGSISIQYGFLKKSQNYKITLDNSLFIFVVPINTTLSTMDKMLSLFLTKLNKSLQVKGEQSEIALYDRIKALLFCLITIGPKGAKHNNIYWEKINNQLIPKEGRFVQLKKTSVTSFAYVESDWTYASFKQLDNTGSLDLCPYCYPDRRIPYKKSALLNESPIFDVTRGSIVPMLQLGKIEYMTPISSALLIDNQQNEFINNTLSNLRRLWQFSEHMMYKHIVRGDNHYQYYFDAAGFLSNHMEEAEDYLKKLPLPDKPKENVVVYNYIVAPRHETNAKWVNLVYSSVFDNKDTPKEGYCGARVLYFEVSKEFRSNLKAKYSDFYREVENIILCGEKFQIRFHYVDETIVSGNTFIRASDLVRSLLSEIDMRNHTLNIVLFHSIFLLYGRSSMDTKRFYYNLFKEANLQTNQECTPNTNHQELYDQLLQNQFHEYVHINISQMRNHEDACTLCKLVNDYRTIQKHCATNKLAKMCNSFIYDHQMVHIPGRDNEEGGSTENLGVNYCSYEKRLLFYITNVLNERLCANNHPLFIKTKRKEHNLKQIDMESAGTVDQIYELLKDYYENLYKYSDELKTENKKRDFIEDYKNAFIKAISRPFFIFHIRKRQASFRFCLEVLDNLLKEGCTNNCIKENSDNSRLIKTLVKALSDMSSNYIIRKSEENAPLSELIKWGEKGDQKKEETVDTAEIYNFQRKDTFKMFTSKDLLILIKKMMTLTQDTTKSLLLEQILVNDSENSFFGIKSLGENNNSINKRFFNNNLLSVSALLYLENNRIIIDALENFEKSKKPPKDLPYYYDNFKDLCAINHFYEIDKRENIVSGFIEAYQNVCTIIENKDLKGLDKEINTWLQELLMLANDNLDEAFSVTSFLYDKNQVNLDDSKRPKPLFELIKLSEGSKKEEQAFYNEKNTNAILAVLCDAQTIENDLIFYKNTNQSVTNVVVLFKEDEQLNYMLDKRIISQEENTLYFLIRKFDTNNINHWFALKMFLTLRHKLSGFIKKINIPVVIKAKAEEMRKRALDNNKAVAHQDANMFFSPFLFPQESKIDYSKNCEKYLQHYYEGIGNYRDKVLRKLPYDKYYQLIANEFISSMYRKVIRGDIRKTCKYALNSIPLSIIQEQIKETFGVDVDSNIAKIACFGRSKSDNNENEEKKDTYYKKMDLQFSFLNSEKAKDIVFTESINMNGHMNSIVLLIWVMAMNAVEHGNEDTNTLLVSFNEDSLVFQNDFEMNDNDSSDEFDNYLATPPWFYDQGDQHITLWTLKKCFDEESLIDVLADEKRKLSVDSKYKKFNVDRSNNKFTVTFNFFSAAKKIKDGKAIFDDMFEE